MCVLTSSTITPTILVHQNFMNMHIIKCVYHHDNATLQK